VDEQSVVRGIGWASLGSGFVCMAMPGVMSRVFGMGSMPRLLRLYGVRDTLIGAGLLTQPDLGVWLGARAVADGADAAQLGTGMLLGRFRRWNAKLSLVLAVASSVGAIALSRRLTSR